MSRIDRPGLRRRLRDLHLRLGALLDCLDVALPTFPGVVYRLKTRCGKPRCACLQGRLHAAWCVSYLEGGKRRLRTIPPTLLERLQALARRYRRLRECRAQMNRAFGQMIQIFDRLERSLRLSPSRALSGSKKGDS